MKKVVALIVARNEEKNIFNVISALKNQTLPISNIVFVDDGSIDKTVNIAESLDCILLSLPFHKENLVGTPDLSIRWNIGLKTVIKYSPDYVLLMGGDHILHKNYVEELLNNMTGKIIIASGRISGEGFKKTAPRGSGRLVKVSFWMNINKMQYPINYGWESWILFKAMQQGFETRCFRNIITKIERPTSIKNISLSGKSLYAKGYNWKYVLHRCLSYRSISKGFLLFWSWFRHNNVERLDVAEFVNEMQNKRFWDQLKKIIRGPFLK